MRRLIGSQRARVTIAAVVAIATVWWLWRAGDPHAVFELLRGAHTLTLVLSVSLLMASLIAKAVRWRALMPRPHTLGALEALRIFHVSILLNNLLPFRLGDGARLVSDPVRRAVTRRQALSVLIAERLIDGVTLAAAALVALPLFARSGASGTAHVVVLRPGGTAATLAFAAALVLVAACLAWRSALRRRGRVHRWVTAFVEDLRIVARMGGRQAGIAAGLTAVAWICTFALHYALLTAIGIEGSLTLAVVVTLATNVSMLVPATPANVGVGHAAAAAPLLAWGLPADLSVAYAVLVHSVNTVPPTLVGLGCVAVTWLPSRAPPPTGIVTSAHGRRGR